MTPEVAKAARDLASRDWPVFPVGPDKKPRVKWSEDATTDPEVVEVWERAGLWDNDAMIGMKVPEGIVIIDIDPRNGGTETWAAVLGDRKYRQTRTVKTRSGGTHIYFRTDLTPEQLRPSLGPGIDVKRAGKGYVVVPPSEGYSFIKGGAPSDVPDWLIEELHVVAAPRGGNGEASPPKYFPFEFGTAYGLGGLERILGRLAQAEPGDRNNSLNKAAFGAAQLVAGGELDETHAQEALYELALKIGQGAGEAKATILSGWAAGEQEPRQAPPPDAPSAQPDPLNVVQPSPEDDECAPFKWVAWEVDEPDPPFFAWPVLPENAYVLVYGATEAAKSMTWLGILAQGSKKGLRSSVYSLENPPSTDRDRLRRFGPDPAYLRLTNEPMNMFDRTYVEAMIEREKEWGTQVVMIDTYSHAFSSHADDGNAKAIAFARVVRHVMAEVGCSFVVIDHTGFVGDEPRDASAKRQQVDVAILMEKNGEWALGQPARWTMQNKKTARFANPFFLGGSIEDGINRSLEVRWADKGIEWRV